MQLYTILFKYYKDNKALDNNVFYKVVDSGFKPCTLHEAITLKSKLNDEHNRLIIVNKV